MLEADAATAEGQPLFWAIFAVAAAYAAAALALSLGQTDHPRGGWRPYVIADAGLLGLLAWSTGGEPAQMRSLLEAIPFAVALIARPRDTAKAAGLALAVYVVAVASRTNPPSAVHFGGRVLLFAWQGGLALLLSVSITAARERREALDEERRTLLTQLEEVGDASRRDLAYALHDGPIQQLYAARLQQQQAATRPGALEAAARAIDGAIDQLRAIVAGLRPADPRRLGLGDALSEVAAQLARRAGAPELDVVTERDLPPAHDELLFQVGRELMTNAVRHAAARHVSLTVGADTDVIVLEIEDDGRGLSPARAAEAWRDGHIGLASCRERLASRNGHLEVRARVGGGTVITATVPR